MGDVYDTRQEAERDRMAFWLDTVCQQILPVQIEPRHDARPRAAMACNRLGSLAIRRVVGSDHIYVRDEHDVRRGDPDTIQIGMPRRGSSILVQDGREADLDAGDKVIYDSSRPFTLVMEDRFNWQVFLLPKERLRRSEAELRSLTAIPLSGSSGMSGVIFQFLSRLASDIDALEADPTADALGENAADLIATMVHSQFGVPWAVGDPDAVLREQVRSFIVRNHFDQRLDPSAIADAHSISVHRLHQLFEGSSTTVMDLVRTERLEAARRDLGDPSLSHLSIGQVATRHGFGTSTVFGRQFRTQFGSTPTQVRAQLRATRILWGASRETHENSVSQRRPPVASTTAPVTHPEPGESSIATAPAMSSGVARRCMALDLDMASIALSLVPSRRVCVSVAPGRTTLTVTPRGASSLAATRAADSRPAFAAA